jgi:hypothetical protein
MSSEEEPYRAFEQGFTEVLAEKEYNLDLRTRSRARFSCPKPKIVGPLPSIPTAPKGKNFPNVPVGTLGLASLVQGDYWCVPYRLPVFTFR